MPTYEYKCQNCLNRTNVRMSYEEYDLAKRPRCPKCNTYSMQRIISPVRVTRSNKSRVNSMPSPETFSSLDQNDPKSVGKLMRNMGNEMTEDLGSEFDEMVTRLESGESPESIEADLT